MKNHQVVMLPAYGKAKIGDFVLGLVNGGNQRLFFGKKVQDAVNCAETNFHLYILSDEEIKEGDWFMYNKKFYNRIKRSSLDCTVKIKIFKDFDLAEQFGYKDTWVEVYKNDCKKIIATTDRSLGNIFKVNHGLSNTTGFEPLPQPSQEFIEYFVDEYNKGNVIAEVGVEYENEDMDFDPAGPNGINWVKKLKINPDNTINIKPQKEKWSREEVIVLLQKLADDIDNNYRPYTRDNSIGFDMLNNDGQWIKENL